MANPFEARRDATMYRGKEAEAAPTVEKPAPAPVVTEARSQSFSVKLPPVRSIENKKVTRSCSLSRDTIARVEAIAKKRGVSTSSIIEALIRAGLEQIESEE